MTEQSEGAAAQRVAEQARLRKERREARIKAGGSSRLNKITGVAGNLPKETPSPRAASPAPASSTAPIPSSTATRTSDNDETQAPHHPDPAEGDISQHQHFPSRPSDSQLRQMMLNFDTPPTSNTPPPMGGPGADPSGMPPMPPGMENDPMAQMLHQMMMSSGPAPGGAAGGNPFGAGAGAPVNPLAALTSLLNPQAAAGPGGPGQDPFAQPPKTQRAPPANPLHIWRILHTLASLACIIYFIHATPFTGTVAQRQLYASTSAESDAHLRSPTDPSTDPADEIFNSYEPDPTHPAFAAAQRSFFLAFATLETFLLTSRYLVETFSPGSRMDAARSGSMLWTVAGILPAPFGGWLSTALRYKSIFDTLLTDLLLVVFVLGVAAWVRS